MSATGGAVADGTTVAVTGAAGYIGSRVVACLQAAHPDWDIVALDNFYRSQVSSIGDCEVDDVDVRDRAALEATLEGADAVCHLAAMSGVEDCTDNPDRAYETNVQGTENVAWWCHKTGAALVFPFSMAVVGDPVEQPITVDHPRDPLNWYGRTKLLNERAVETLADGAFPAHQLLLANLYGRHRVDGTDVSKPTVINIFLDQARESGRLTVHEPGTQARNFVHVDDVARAHVAACETALAERAAGDTGSTAYPVAGEEDPSVLELAELVKDVGRDVAGLEVTVDVVPNPRGDAETLVESFAVDTSKTRATIGWSPEHRIEDAVRRVLADEAPPSN